MSPRPSQRDSKVDLIVSSTTTLIMENGLEAVSMTAIADRSGLSRPAVYQYFPSTQHVLAEVLVNELADFSNELDAHLMAFDDALERVRIWLHFSLTYMSSERHRIIRQVSTEGFPDETRGLLRAMHGHVMTSLISPLTTLGVADATSVAHLLYASVAKAAERIDAGAEFIFEARALEHFAIAGVKANLGSANG
ncbi:MAG: TetR/AcrR family transcriptional regulator [Micrococcales bacterium]